MAVPPKKKFDIYNKTQDAILKNVSKYAQQARRAIFCLIEDKSGLHPFGTKLLMELWHEQPDEWKRKWIAAANGDSRNLNAKDDLAVSASLPDNPQKTRGALYRGSVPAKLRCKVDLLNEKEARVWLMPELYKDLAESGINVSRINWGDESHRPRCWADDVVDWTWITNIAHSQKNKLPVKIVEVLRKTIKNRLGFLSIDPEKHIEDESIDSEAKQRKMKFHKNNKLLAPPEIETPKNEGFVEVKAENMEWDIVELSHNEMLPQFIRQSVIVRSY